MSRRTVAACCLALLLAAEASAAPLRMGQAQGTLVVDKQKIPLYFAYAVGRQDNEANGRRDDVKVILTDRALPDGFDLAKIESAFPPGVNGVVVNIDNDRKPSHVFVHHPTGMYDAGYFIDNDRYRFKGKIGDGVIEGRVSSRRIETATVQFAYEVNFVAAIR